MKSENSHIKEILERISEIHNPDLGILDEDNEELNQLLTELYNLIMEENKNE